MVWVSEICEYLVIIVRWIQKMSIYVDVCICVCGIKQVLYYFTSWLTGAL